jgi:hypothetical protein
MAEWKKLVVSGSSISQLANDKNYLINAQSGAVLSGSFSGSFEGDGSRLTGLTVGPVIQTGSVSAAVNVTGNVFTVQSGSAEFLKVTDKGGVALRTGDVTATDGVALGNSGDVTGDYSVVTGLGSSATGTHQTIVGQFNSESLDTAAFVIGNGTNPSHRSNLVVASGSEFRVGGTVAIAVSGSNPLALTVSGSSNFTGSVDIAGNTSVTGDATVTGNATVVGDTVLSGSLKLQPGTGGATGSFSGSFTGDGSGLSGIPSTLKINTVSGSNTTASINLLDQALSLTGSANQVVVTAAANSTLVGFKLADDLRIQTASIAQDLTIEGNLYVNGTTTTINTTELTIEDTFITLASGSANATDAGIVIDRGAFTSGSIAYGFDAGTGTWGYQNNITSTSNLLNLNLAKNSAIAGMVLLESVHGAIDGTNIVESEFRKAGAMYVANSGDVYIFS